MPPILWRVCLIACLAAVAVAGIDWGLPTPDDGPYLFDSHAPWDGARLAAYDAERVDPGQAADVDRDPVARDAGPVVLNATDADRAAILRRYRLFSHQPDEMITFMALQQMSPAQRQFDPRLYQYGGLWIYPVGGLLKVCSSLGWVDVRPDKAFYYDHPDAFGRLYVVARAYTLLAYVLTMVFAGMIVKRLTDDDFAAAVGAAVVGVLPVVFAMAHEAKPHLGGTALILAATLAGARWVRTGRRRDAVLTGAFTGLAVGMVLSAAVAAVIPLVMVFLPHPLQGGPRSDSPGRRLAAFGIATVAAVVCFTATNPYLVLHAIHRDPVLTKNLANTQAMYGVGSPLDAVRDGGRRLLEALSIPAAAVAGISLVVAVTGRRQVSALAILLIVPGIMVLGQFFLLAAGKPPEYARFALLPAAGLGVLLVWAISTVRHGRLRQLTLTAVPLVIFAVGTLPYQRAFAADTTDGNTRAQAALLLRQSAGGRTLQVTAEPAPYCVPAFDLWAWRVVLSGPADPPVGDVILHPLDAPPAVDPPLGYRRAIVGDADCRAPITWANKPIELLTSDRPAPTTP